MYCMLAILHQYNQYWGQWNTKLTLRINKQRIWRKYQCLHYVIIISVQFINILQLGILIIHICIQTHLEEWMIGLGKAAWMKWPIASGNTDK